MLVLTVLFASMLVAFTVFKFALARGERHHREYQLEQATNARRLSVLRLDLERWVLQAREGLYQEILQDIEIKRAERVKQDGLGGGDVN